MKSQHTDGAGTGAGAAARASDVLELKGSMNRWRHRRVELVLERDELECDGLLAYDGHSSASVTSMGASSGMGGESTLVPPGY